MPGAKQSSTCTDAHVRSSSLAIRLQKFLNRACSADFTAVPTKELITHTLLWARKETPKPTTLFIYSSPADIQGAPSGGRPGISAAPDEEGAGVSEGEGSPQKQKLHPSTCNFINTIVVWQIGKCLLCWQNAWSRRNSWHSMNMTWNAEETVTVWSCMAL